MTLLTTLNKVLRRVSRVVDGKPSSVKSGRSSHAVEEELALDLVSLSEGSVAAVLGFERTKDEPTLFGPNIGQSVLEKAITGLAAAQELEPDGALPEGYDDGVIEAWLDARPMFNKGVNSIAFGLQGTDQPLRVSFTREGLDKIEVLIGTPSSRESEVEGQLLMVDLGKVSPRLEIYPSGADPLRCTFDDDLRQVVKDNLTKFVRVNGIAVQDSKSGRIKTIHAHTIEPLDSPRSFWESVSLEELINEQQVAPVNDLTVLYGSWPGESNDGFEEAVNQLRRLQIENEE